MSRDAALDGIAAQAPAVRAAKTLRRLLFNVPARIARTGRRTILHLPEGFRHAWIFRPRSTRSTRCPLT